MTIESPMQPQRKIKKRLVDTTLVRLAHDRAKSINRVCAAELLLLLLLLRFVCSLVEGAGTVEHVPGG